MAGASPNGTVNLLARDNNIVGPARYGIMLHAGQPTRGASYTGRIDAEFDDNAIDRAVVNRALITFTNSRATVRPSELRSTWEYLTAAQYVLRHRGELANALIDHPKFHPIDAYALGNLLRMNDQTITNRTFLIVPAP